MNRLNVAALLCAALWLVSPQLAEACGCFSPPVPDPVAGDEFAVNQEAEQIIFEVPGDGTVTAHVLIRYQGKPSSFTWIVPVPSVPELALSTTIEIRNIRVAGSDEKLKFVFDVPIRE